jgi:hypothetical protein
MDDIIEISSDKQTNRQTNGETETAICHLFDSFLSSPLLFAGREWNSLEEKQDYPTSIQFNRNISVDWIETITKVPMQY